MIDSKMDNPEYERILQENVTLKSDTLIFREDIKHLTEVNKRLESELEISRKKILDLVNENDNYQNQLCQKSLEIDKLTQAITRLRLFDNPDVEFTLENRKNKDQRIQELEFENKNLTEEKIKLSTEHRILIERFNEFKSQNDDLSKELNFSKMRENEQINVLEDKIRNLELQLDSIGRENNSLRLTDEKFRRELQLITKEKETYLNKYQKKKDQLNQLSQRYNELDMQYKKIQLDYQGLLNTQNMKEEHKVQKDNGKQKVFNDLYRKIQLFKTQMKTKRANSPVSNNQNQSGSSLGFGIDN